MCVHGHQAVDVLFVVYFRIYNSNYILFFSFLFIMLLLTHFVYILLYETAAMTHLRKVPRIVDLQLHVAFHSLRMQAIT